MSVAKDFVNDVRRRYREQRVFRWAVELLSLSVIVLTVGAFQARHHPRGPAPDYALSTLDGTLVQLHSLRGKPTLLVVWAPWCGVCKTQSDNVSRVRQWLGERAQVLSVVTAFNTVESVRRAVEAQHMDYPVYLADDDFSSAFRVEAYPTLFVLDATGNIISSTQGYTTTLGFWMRAMWAAWS